jgi:hypothetical protein
MNIHLIGNQVTIIGETILHLSLPCLKQLHDPTLNPWYSYYFILGSKTRRSNPEIDISLYSKLLYIKPREVRESYFIY